jgi:hypothetical protein
MRSQRALCASLLFFLLVPGAVLAGDQPHWGRLYVVAANVHVHESPSDAALTVRVLKAGQKIRIDFLDDGWVAVFDPKEPKRSELCALGYVKLAALQGNGAQELAQTSFIEARKPAPGVKSEVLADGRPEERGGSPKTSGKTAGALMSKTAGKSKPSEDKGFGELRVADRRLTVRAARDKDSVFRKVLKPGQLVRVDFLEDGWFAVFDPAEKVRDLKNAWGYSRDKYLVPESAYVALPVDAVASASATAAAPLPSAATAAPGKAQKVEAVAVGYTVLSRKAEKRKPSVATMRVRLDMVRSPAPETLRKIVSEIWKAERRKDEELQLEVLLTGMDAHGLAYAVAKFQDNGHLKEFWWRDVVTGRADK